MSVVEETLVYILAGKVVEGAEPGPALAQERARPSTSSMYIEMKGLDDRAIFTNMLSQVSPAIRGG